MSAAHVLNPLDLIEAQIEGLRQRVKDVDALLLVARRDNAYLKQENAQLWESVRERDAQILELTSMRGACDR